MAGDMVNTKQRLIALSKRRSTRYGVPFILFIVAASFGLQEFTKIRYQYRKIADYHEKLKEAELDVRDKSEVTLDAQYENIKKLNTDDWENKRIARPWEDSQGAT